MANIANLAVQLTAKTGQFTSGMNAARQPVRNFASSIQAASSQASMFIGMLGSAATALGIYSAVSRIEELVKASYETIDALAKASDKLGLSTEALGGFRYAADKAGMESRTLDMALQRMTRRMSEAAHGTGEAKGAIKELGLDAKALSGLPLDSQLYRVADALADVANPADRVRLAFKLFDSEGVAMVNVLAKGSEGLKAAQNEFEALGGAVSRLDAAKIEAANDAIRGLKASVQGLGNELAINTAPMVSLAVRGFNEWIKASNGLGSAIRDTATALEDFMNPVSKLDHAWERYNERIRSITILLGQYDSRIASVSGKIVDAFEFIRNVLMHPIKTGPLGVALGSLLDKLDEYGAAAEMAIALEAQHERAARKTADAIREETAALEKLAAEGARIYEETRTPLEKYNAEVAHLNELHKAGKLDADTYNRAIADAGKEYADATEAADELGKRAKAIYEDTRTPWEEYAESIRELNALYDEGRISMDTYGRAVDAAERRLANQDETLKAAAEAQEKLEDSARSVFESTRTPLEEYESEVEKLNNLYDKGMISQDTYFRAIRDARAELDKANGGLDDHIDKLEKIQQLEGKFESGKFLASGGFGPRPFGVRSDFAAPINGYGGLMSMPRGSQDMRMTNELLRQIAMNTQNHIARVG